MRPTDETERWVKTASFEANPEMDKALWADTLTARNKPAADTARRSPLKVVFRSPLTRVAAVVVLVTTLVLWQRFDVAGKAYALSDAIAAISRASTIHIRTTMSKDRVLEYWYDLEQGREYRHDDGTYLKEYNSPDTLRKTTTTVRDGQYLMKIDHQKQTVRFERLLSWEQEFHRRRMADLAMDTALPDVLQHLNRYTRIGRDTIDGKPYDIWRREWRVPKFDRGIRYDIWVAPSDGEIGRTREWNETKSTGWILRSETGKIEVNRQPPMGIFATEPPHGYTLENTKASADIIRDDFLLLRVSPGFELNVLPCLTLEDGSIVAVWTMSGGQAPSDPNTAHAGLTFGGPLPQTPLSVPGLLFAPEGRRYGSVSFGDEILPVTMVPAVGRHLMSTRKASRVYEWALYIPQTVIPKEKSKEQAIIAILKNARSAPAMSISAMISLPVTAEQFAEYIADAFRELSDDPAVPVRMDYDGLLGLAEKVRRNKQLYENFAEETKEVRETSIGDPEPVEIQPSDETQ